MRLKSAIYRNSCKLSLCLLLKSLIIIRFLVIGSFGYGTVMRFNDGQKSFVRSLNSRFTTNLSLCSKILEELILLKHEYICEVRDYDICERGDKLPAIVVVRHECCLQNLQEFFSTNTEIFPAHQYIFWFYQVNLFLTFYCK